MLRYFCSSLTVLFLLSASGVPAPAQEEKNETTEVKPDEKKAEIKKPEEKAAESPVSRKPDYAKNGEIVITATKSEINRRETGSSVTVISSEDIERKGRREISELLEDVPGLSVTRNSSFGGSTFASIRGSDHTSVVVLIDGVKVNDPSSADKGFDLAGLTTDNVERVEIIRGSQSTLYGSDAMGGVINIITKKGKGDPRITIRTEAGSFHTYNEMAGVSGGSDGAFYSFAASRIDSRGFSKSSKPQHCAGRYERDPYENTTLSARLGVRTVMDSWISFAMRYYDSSAGLDGYLPYVDEHYKKTEGDLMAANIDYAIPLFSWWESRLTFSYMNQSRKIRDLPDMFDTSYSDMFFRGKMRKAEWKNRFIIAEVDEISIGGEIEEDKAATMMFSSMYSSYGIDKTNYQKAAYLQNHLKLMKRIFITAGVRYSEPDHYKSNLSYSTSGSFILPMTETRIKSNFSTGYKIPSLYQRYDSMYGNIYLKPESSKSWDAGIEQPLWKEKINLECNYFSIDTDRMILFDFTLGQYGMYRNSNSFARGVESLLSIKPIEDLKLEANYTYQIAKNKDNNRPLLRRPEHKVGANLNISFLDKKANINLGFIYVGRRMDLSIFTFAGYNYNFSTLELLLFKYFPQSAPINSYYKLDASASYWIIDNLQAFIRCENLLNANYEEVRGYKTPERSFYGGLKLVL